MKLYLIYGQILQMKSFLGCILFQIIFQRIQWLRQFQKLIFNMIRGTTHDQDARFADKTKRMIEKSNWPDKYDIKIDLKKVDYQLIKVWIQKRITKLLGEEDDIISGTIISHMDENIEKQEKLNAKQLHVAISGFLQDKTLTFMSQLWDLLDQAQRSSRGIPQCLIEEKKKSEHVHRRKLQELGQKRHKINTHYFNQIIKPSRNNSDFKAQSQRGPQRQRQKGREQTEKSKKNRDRSRSRNKHKKKRSRSNDKRRRERERSKDKDHRRQKQRHRSDSSGISASPKKKSNGRDGRRKRSESSDSSGVVSSSN